MLSVHRAGDPHDQQGHLLVVGQEPSLLAIAKGLLAHRAGVDRPHGREEILEPAFPRTLVRAEHALVLAGEGVAVIVFEE